MPYRWEIAARPEPGSVTFAWLQDDSGRFTGAEAGGGLHSEASGDLEQFDPRRCRHCEDHAGWLPPSFDYCLVCGQALERARGETLAIGDSHWPRLALSAADLPIPVRPVRHALPRGADFTFLRLPRRDRLVALAGDSGRVWVWSRPGADWRPLLSPPTGYHAVPPALFGALAVDAVVVYPTAAGAVWIDTSPAGPVHAEVSEWQPLAAPALLADCVLMPAVDADGAICIARRRPGDTDWQMATVDTTGRRAPAGDPPPLPGEQWLSRPVVEDDQVHWVGADGLLRCDRDGEARWCGWHAGFKPVLGPPVLETRDGRFWQIGHAPDTQGDWRWAFASVAVNAAPECKWVDGAFFSAGRLCFRLDERHLDPPWHEQSWSRQGHTLPGNSFLLPVCALGGEGALLLCVQDRSVTTDLLQGGVEVRGELFLSRAPGHLESLQAILSFDGRRRPQPFTWDQHLWVYDPIDGELDAWPLESRRRTADSSTGENHG